MPELGSKISLISKADIRYEGRLFTVDPQECTIALANVRSFGTEDRESQYPIAPQSQIYDYILYRGTDIKDIRVVNNGMPHPNDPTIMEMQLPNGQHLMPHFPIPAMNPPMVSVLDLLTEASRSTTPVSLISRKSPSADMGVQVNQNAGNYRDQQGHKRQNQSVQPRSNNTSGSGTGVVGGGGGGCCSSIGNYQRDRRDSGKMSDHQYNQQHQQDNRNHQRNEMQNNQNRGWINRGNNNMRGGGARGRDRMQNQQGSYRQTGGNNQNKERPKNTIKFEQDYDFEQANKKFEELRSQLSKLKVKVNTDQVNGKIDKKDDSGNETGAGEHEQEQEEISVGYDKTKSFFDNISCEAATDRSKGKNRFDWRQERKLNSGTFGISSTRHGNYRGRGSYYNRNMHMHTGGYRGYRGGNNYRGRNNNMNGQSTGLPNNKSIQQQQEQNQQNQQLQPTVAVVVAGK